MRGQADTRALEATAAALRPGRWRRISPRHWSLRLRLVFGQVLLVTALAAGIGATTELALRTYLIHQLDMRLIDAEHHSLAAGGDPRFRLPAPPGSPPIRPCGLPASAGSPVPLPPLYCHPSGGAGDFLRAPGTAPDTLMAIVTADRIRIAGRIVGDGTVEALSDATERRLTACYRMTVPTTVDFSGLGHYRLIAQQNWHGETVLTGMPLAEMNATLDRALLVFAVAAVGALALGLLAAIVAVNRALAPLNRVVDAAARVVDLPLHRGEVALRVRVPEPDADPTTEVGLLGATVNRMLDHIDDALSARQRSETRVRQFLADASHELRTPLTAIRGYAEMAGAERVDLDRAMIRVRAEAERMSRLVDDMMLLARLDSGRPLEQEPVDLSELTVDAVSDAHIAGPDHRWDLDLPETPVFALGDRARLQQVLTNLLANAHIHTGLGTLVTVALSTGVSGEVVWSVTDDGPGIPPELQPEIFERFVRADSSRSRRAGSSGLGLAIVAAVVKAHAGTIEVNSVAGRTEFVVRLPAAPGVDCIAGRVPSLIRATPTTAFHTDDP